MADRCLSSRGEVVLKSVAMRYRVGLPPALNGVTLRIRGGEKVGICGRSGAGKSTLIALLFRVVRSELVSGTISIDGVDIMRMGLQPLRRAIAVIPQHPLLLEGTLANNLDPFGVYPPSKLVEVLQAVGFNLDSDSAAASLEEQLQRDTGSLSAGQRQLVSFGRVLLREEAVAPIAMNRNKKTMMSSSIIILVDLQWY